MLYSKRFRLQKAEAKKELSFKHNSQGVSQCNSPVLPEACTDMP